jgi:hypothetical protein
MSPDSGRYAAAVAAFDAAHREDPQTTVINGVPRPHALVYAERLSAWVERLAAEASEPLRLAARCQHLRRWAIPRSQYDEGRVGYLKWRSELARFHASQSEAILRNVGYDDETIAAVRRINLKQGLRSASDTQTMEDALCLSFLEHELEEFSHKHERDKVVDVLRKSWRKMSERGRAVALELPLPDSLRGLVEEALRL